MHPAFLDSMSWAMAEVYASVTDQIMVNIASYFPFFKNRAKIPNEFDYQARMLAQMGQVRKETIDIIMKGLSGADDTLRKAIEDAILDALEREEPALLEAAKKGLTGAIPTVEVSPGQMQAFQAYYKQSADKLNLVNTVMLESTEAAYKSTVADITQKIQRTQSILNTAAGETITGVSSLNTSLHRAVRKMVQNGLTGFIDHAGRRWSPETYVAMDIRTTVFNTARAAVWERADSYGADLYQVSTHNGARPLCYPWQQKIISRSDMSGETEDIDGNKLTIYPQSSTSYGQPAGLFGINCQHYPMTFIPGFSAIRGDPMPEEENAKFYEETQEQRGLERKLRAERRDYDILKAMGASEEELERQRARVDEASKAIDTFCDKTGHPRRRNREWTPVNAKFPPKNSYDPATFPTEVRDRMQEFFKGGMNLHGNVGAVGQIEQTVPKPEIRLGKPFDTENADPKLKQYLEDAKKDILNAPENIQSLWSKCAEGSSRLPKPVYGEGTKGCYCMGATPCFETVEDAFVEDTIHRKNAVFFHEYGHAINMFCGDYDNSLPFSYIYKNNVFGKTIYKECQERVKEFARQKYKITDEAEVTAKAKTGVVGRAFRAWVIMNYNEHERADISDMFVKYFGRTYGISKPFGVGHSRSYFENKTMLPDEAFAEMFSASISQKESLETIKTFFPESFKIFEEMIQEMLR